MKYTNVRVSYHKCTYCTLKANNLVQSLTVLQIILVKNKNKKHGENKKKQHKSIILLYGSYVTLHFATDCVRFISYRV